jgi:pyruvate dehydrogenase E2 component (dihydrolipoamide acetyltransferase)
LEAKWEALTVDENSIFAVTVPKWGMSMEEGQVTAWHVREGDEVSVGQEIVDIESTKIAGSVEAKVSGTLRRQVARIGQTLRVGALIGVFADRSVPEATLDEFVSRFVVDADEGEEGSKEAEILSADLSAGKVKYTVHGDGGEPILLVHGFGGDLNNWLFNFGPLSAAHTVYAVDLPGHGGSTKTLPTGTMSELSASIREFLAKVIAAPAHLVGHSLGGGICQLVASEAPDLVSSLTLIAPVGLGPEINQSYLSGFMDSKNRRDLRAAVSQLFGDQSIVTTRMVDDILRYKRLVGVDQALDRMINANFPGGVQLAIMAQQTESLGIPVMLIWGHEDRIVPMHHASALPSAKKITLNSIGHMPMMESPGKVNEAILNFIEEQGQSIHS